MKGQRPIATRNITTANPTERPMTSTKGAGYTRNLGKDPRDLEQNRNQMLFSKKEPTTKEQIVKELEKNIQKIYDESIILKCKKDLHGAKDKCTTAYEKFHEYKARNQDYINIELEFGIKFNLALINQTMGLLEDAKNIYQEILKLENYYSVGTQHHRIRVNLGNILYQEGKYKNAITEYKKAVDKISKDNKELRANIMKNIALTHIQMGNYADAIESYTEALKSNPDIRTAMNLLLCHLAVGDIEHTKNVFNVMLDVSAYSTGEPTYNETDKQNIDPYQEYMLMKKKDTTSILVNIALMLTHYLDKDPLIAFDHVIEQIKKNEIKDILNEIEMAKAMHFLKKRDVEKTISIMKSFENKDKRIISRVSNNISFLYFIEGDINNAEKYANLALENERYNHKALVNKGNIHYAKDDYTRAKEFYLEAIGVQADCIEAIYNLGMVNIRMEGTYEAIQAFEKLNSIVPNIPEVLYKIAKQYELIKDFDNAIKYYSLLLALIPNDPILLSNLGSLYYQINPKDEKNYMHYFEESYRYFPSNFDNLIILGFLYFRDEIYEKAIQYFELASKVQPDNYTADIQYAKCFYKLGNYREAYRAFKKIHEKFPDNREALTFLIAACKDLGHPYEEFNQKLIKLERDQITNVYDSGNYYQDQQQQSYGGGYGGQQQAYGGKMYEGEEVDFTKYSHKGQHTQQQPSKPINKFSQLERQEDMLP